MPDETLLQLPTAKASVPRSTQAGKYQGIISICHVRQPTEIHTSAVSIHDGGTIVQVAASQETSSKLCSEVKPIALNPSGLPSPSICEVD